MPWRAPEILLVSKPLSPPWDDSGKLLPFLLSQQLCSVRPLVLVPRGAPLVWHGGRSEEVYGRASSFRVPSLDKVCLLWWLMAHQPPHLVHFFFSPNPMTTTMGRLFRKVHPRSCVLQTVMSLPKGTLAQAGGLFGDVIVVWSEHARRLVEQHLDAGAGRLRKDSDRAVTFPRVVHIPPGIVPLEPMTRDERRTARASMGLPPDTPIILFAGDLEFSRAAEVLAGAALQVLEQMSAVFVFACRAKTPAAAVASQTLQARLAGPIASGHVRFPATVPVFSELLRCVDVQVLPADTTYAKTDLPLVLLEGMSAGVPAVVGVGTAMDELVSRGAATGVDPASETALAEVLAHLGRNPEARMAAGDAARTLVMQRHTATHMAMQHDRLYRELSDA